LDFIWTRIADALLTEGGHQPRGEYRAGAGKGGEHGVVWERGGELGDLLVEALHRCCTKVSTSRQLGTMTAGSEVNAVAVRIPCTRRSMVRG
jgi:hypothetical protein